MCVKGQMNNRKDDERIGKKTIQYTDKRNRL